MNIFRFYYFGTPVFMALDYWVGMPIRVAGLDEPGQRLIYYVFCLVCAVVCYVAP